jgi:hypothetical protein
MPLNPDPSTLDEGALQALDEALHGKLVATRTLLGTLASALHDPSELETASDLLRAMLALLDRPGPRTREELVREVDLSNAALLAAIDLVKTYADQPRVHRAHPKSARR